MSQCCCFYRSHPVVAFRQNCRQPIDLRLTQNLRHLSTECSPVARLATFFLREIGFTMFLGKSLGSLSQCLAPVGLAEAAACTCDDASAEADFQTFLSAWDTSFKLWSYCYIVRKKQTQNMTSLSDGNFTFALSIFEVWTCCY